MTLMTALVVRSHWMAIIAALKAGYHLMALMAAFVTGSDGCNCHSNTPE